MKSDASPADKRATMLYFDEVLGLGLASWQEEVLIIPQAVQMLAEARWQARLAKNWLEADRLRQALAEEGFVMNDGAEGYTLAQTKT